MEAAIQESLKSLEHARTPRNMCDAIVGLYNNRRRANREETINDVRSCIRADALGRFTLYQMLMEHPGAHMRDAGRICSIPKPYTLVEPEHAVMLHKVVGLHELSGFEVRMGMGMATNYDYAGIGLVVVDITERDPSSQFNTFGGDIGSEGQTLLQDADIMMHKAWDNTASMEERIEFHENPYRRINRNYRFQSTRAFLVEKGGNYQPSSHGNIHGDEYPHVYMMELDGVRYSISLFSAAEGQVVGGIRL